jgi:hypothetical protein
VVRRLETERSSGHREELKRKERRKESSNEIDVFPNSRTILFIGKKREREKGGEIEEEGTSK